MPRVLPIDRFPQLIQDASQIFIAHGYSRTQMEDVSAAAGIAKGTLYSYVESKAALLDAALRYSDRIEPLPSPAELPLPTPPAGTTVAHVRKRLEAETQGLALAAALNRKRVSNPTVELSEIVNDLYRRLARNRNGIKLLDRLSSEFPEFSELWFGEGRWAQHSALLNYLDRRMAMGAFKPLPNTPIVARAILETITFWAVHRHWDPSPQQVAEVDVEATVTELILRWLIKE